MSTLLAEKNRFHFFKGKKKLRPILSQKDIKITKVPLIKTRNLSNIKLSSNNLKDDILSFLFQENDLDLVRSLNINSNNNLCNNIMLKNKLKNKLMILSIENNKKSNTISTEKEAKNSPQFSEIDQIIEKRKGMQKHLSFFQLENEISKKLKSIRDEYEYKQKEKNILYKKLNSALNRVEELNLEIKLLETNDIPPKIREKKSNFFQNDRNSILQKNKNKLTTTISGNNKLPNLTKNESNENSSSRKIRQNLEGKILIPRNIFQIRRDQKKIKSEEVISLNEQIIKYNKDIEKAEKELTEMKNKENAFISKLMEHYEELLYKGEEVRNEGLIWIIKAMWSIGENVPMLFIPPFLDYKCIQYLFKYAAKSIELDKNKKILNDIKKNLQKKIHNMFYKSKTKTHRLKSSFEFKTDLIKKNKISKQSIFQHNFINPYLSANADESLDENINSVKEMSKFMEKNSSKIDFNKLSGLENVEKLKIKINEIENEIMELKKEEVNRIFKEYVSNDYENKFHAPIEKVLGALIGEHNKNIEINKFNKYKKEYLDVMKNIRFFQHGKDSKEL